MGSSETDGFLRVGNIVAATVAFRFGERMGQRRQDGVLSLRRGILRRQQSGRRPIWTCVVWDSHCG